MRKHLLVDFQHNRSILDHIDNKFSAWFSFSIVPLFVFGTTRRISLHYGHNLTFRNGRSFRDCTHITFRLISFAQLLQFQHWYIIILWFHCTIIFIEVAHHHCFSFVTTYFLLLILNLTSSLRVCFRSRFLFLLRIKISVSKGFVVSLYFVVTPSFHSFICCVFSPVVLMNLRQLMRLLINDLLMAVVLCDNLVHQQWDRKRHQRLSLVSRQSMSTVLEHNVLLFDSHHFASYSFIDSVIPCLCWLIDWFMCLIHYVTRRACIDWLTLFVHLLCQVID